MTLTRPLTQTLLATCLTGLACVMLVCVLMTGSALADQVTGTVTYRQRIALPPEARLEVILADISRQDAPAVTVARRMFTISHQVPIPFVLIYPASAIKPRQTYAVQAKISIGGQVAFQNTETYLVLTHGHPHVVAMIVSPVSAPVPAAQSSASIAQSSATITTTRHTLKSGKPGHWTSEIDYPRFQTDSALAIHANQAIQAWVFAQNDDFRKQSQTDLKADPHPIAPYEQKVTSVVGAVAPTVLSLYFTLSLYTGGAHENIGYAGMTFGIARGHAKMLTLKDLFLRGVDPIKSLTPPVIKALKARGASEVVSGHITHLDSNLTASWVVTPTGITVLIPPYAVGAFAEGAFFIKVTFTELHGSLDPNGPLKALLAAQH